MHTDHCHHWHLETLGRLVAADPTVLASTDVRMVELEAPQNCAEACCSPGSSVAAGNTCGYSAGRTTHAGSSREFALGVEGLSRFVAREPLRRVHECVFGVLALESEPVDPRM